MVIAQFRESLQTNQRSASSVETLPGIDIERPAGNVSGVEGNQESSCAGNFFGGSDMPERIRSCSRFLRRACH